MPIIVEFEQDSAEDLAHYGVLGMKWGVRKEETKRKYENAKRYASETPMRRMAKKDAKKTMETKYDYGAQSQNRRKAQAKVVAERSKKLGDSYSKNYEKALGKLDAEKYAIKSQKSLERDRRLAAKPKDSLGKQMLKATAGSAIGYTAGKLAVATAIVGLSKYAGVQYIPSRTVVLGAEYLGASIGANIATRGERKRIAARRKLNYRY